MLRRALVGEAQLAALKADKTSILSLELNMCAPGSGPLASP